MPLQLAVFDFDLTLTVVHVFNALTGGQAGIAVPPPFAKSELGQLLRVGELESSQPFRNQGGFSVTVFGGRDRVEVVRQLLQDLRAGGVECVVCTKGLVGPVRKILSNLGLLQFFAQVYGITGNTYGSTDFDLRLGGNPAAAGPDACLLGTPDLSSWNTKRDVVARCLQERRLQASEAVFIDDDPNEVSLVQPVCPTIQVSQRAGMTQREFEMLRRLVPPSQSGGYHKEYDPYVPPVQELSRNPPPSQGNIQNQPSPQRYSPLPQPVRESNWTRQDAGDRYTGPESRAQDQSVNNNYGQYLLQNQNSQQGLYGQRSQYGQQDQNGQQGQYGQQHEYNQQGHDRQNYGGQSKAGGTAGSGYAGRGYGDSGGQGYGQGGYGSGGDRGYGESFGQGYGGHGYEQGGSQSQLHDRQAPSGSRGRSGTGGPNDRNNQGDPRGNDARPYEMGYGPARPAWQADGQVDNRGGGRDSYNDNQGPLHQPLAHNERGVGSSRAESMLAGPPAGGSRARDDWRRGGGNRRLHDGQVVQVEEKAHGAHVCCFQ